MSVSDKNQTASQERAVPHNDNRVMRAMGIDAQGAARNRASLFAAAGVEWPQGLDAEAVHARQTNYPFSVDISNNRLLAALDRHGYIRRAVSAVGLDDVRGNAIPGVYVHKRLAYSEGTIGLEVSINGATRSAPALGFVDGVIPQFDDAACGVAVKRQLFVPPEGESRSLRVVQLVNASNHGASTATLSLNVIQEVNGREPWSEMGVKSHLIDQRGAIEGHQLSLSLAPGESVNCACIVDFFTEHEGSDSDASDVDIDQLIHVRNIAGRQYSGTLGQLTVAEDPWFGEVVTRAAELARQSVLLRPNGEAAGSFWGSNANPLPDVWTRDFAYSAMGLIESSPTLALKAIDLLARYGLPESAWEREAELHPEATGLEHSLGNACIGAVLAALFIKRYGRADVDQHTPNLADYLQRLTAALLAQRPEQGQLYRTLYISDGPSRGDFHTGSNILAWRAAVALSHDFADALSKDEVVALSELSNELHDTISQRCVHVIDGHEMFVEGITTDGRPVGVHDGEESDLTLASLYGFAERDDSRVKEHASWAHSSSNPYYARRTGGVDFWDWDDYNGVTYPGHIHALSSAGTRQQLAAALHAIRQTTDLDGSFWWWPFRHGENDAARVKRGLSKCGWCAGEFVTVMLHDIAGIRRDYDTRTLTVAPYTPWSSFSWNNLAFLDGSVDVEVDARSIRVTNNTSTAFNVRLQLALQPDQMIEDITLDGENFRYQSEVLWLHDSAVVCATARVEAGAAAQLDVVTSA